MPQSLEARLLVLCLGTPMRASEGVIRFELQAGLLSEVWTRHFPVQTMRFRLHLQDGQIIESLGAAQSSFGLEADGDRLVMLLRKLRFLGIACPAWLGQRFVAEERGEGGRLHFRIEAACALPPYRVRQAPGCWPMRVCRSRGLETLWLVDDDCTGQPRMPSCACSMARTGRGVWPGWRG